MWSPRVLTLSVHVWAAPATPYTSACVHFRLFPCLYHCTVGWDIKTPVSWLSPRISVWGTSTILLPWIEPMVAIETKLGIFHQCRGRIKRQTRAHKACCGSPFADRAACFALNDRRRMVSVLRNRSGALSLTSSCDPGSQERLENLNIHAALYSHGRNPSEHLHSDPRTEAWFSSKVTVQPADNGSIKFFFFV